MCPDCRGHGSNDVLNARGWVGTQERWTCVGGAGGWLFPPWQAQLEQRRAWSALGGLCPQESVAVSSFPEQSGRGSEVAAQTEGPTAAHRRHLCAVAVSTLGADGTVVPGTCLSHAFRAGHGGAGLHHGCPTTQLLQVWPVCMSMTSPTLQWPHDLSRHLRTLT